MEILDANPDNEREGKSPGWSMSSGRGGWVIAACDVRVVVLLPCGSSDLCSTTVRDPTCSSSLSHLLPHVCGGMYISFY